MSKRSTSANRVVSPALNPALEQVTASFERFCLLAGLDTLNRLMEWDATALCDRSGDTSAMCASG